jgi:hypothetical protein
LIRVQINEKKKKKLEYHETHANALRTAFQLKRFRDMMNGTLTESGIRSEVEGSPDGVNPTVLF